MGILLSLVRIVLILWAPVARRIVAWAIPLAVFGGTFHTLTKPWAAGWTDGLRVGLAGLFQLTLFLALGPPRPRFRVRGALPTLAVSLLLIPLALQPTLAPLRWDTTAWKGRAVRLADGSAAAHWVDSLLGLWRRRDAPAPRTPEGLDALIAQVAQGDRRRGALLRAFVAVESGGQRFAVSRTGCAGLMQFCGPTARSHPYRSIFGRGRVFRCHCAGACRVSDAARLHLEAGHFDTPEVREGFPCVAGDARFDPHLSLRAGSLFLGRLEDRFGHNLTLLYIGYNSGPAVLDTLRRQLGRGVSPSEAQLARALAPWFGRHAERRAKALLRVHVPKLRRVFDDALRRSV